VAESKQYQFRSSPELDSGLTLVWVKSMTTSDNLRRVIKAGIASLQQHKQGKGGICQKK